MRALSRLSETVEEPEHLISAEELEPYRRENKQRGFEDCLLSTKQQVRQARGNMNAQSRLKRGGEKRAPREEGSEVVIYVPGHSRIS